MLQSVLLHTFFHRRSVTRLQFLLYCTSRQCTALLVSFLHVSKIKEMSSYAYSIATTQPRTINRYIDVIIFDAQGV